MHPMLVPVTLYVPLVDATMEAVVAPLLHRKAEAPDAVSVTKPP